MQNLFLNPAEAAALIEGGATAVFAGSEEALASLPRGKWIGGTTVYFMTESGGAVDHENLFCTLIAEATNAKSVVLSPAELARIGEDRFSSGFSYVLLPAFSDAHRIYALEGPGWPGLYDQPIMGWVTGVHLSELGRRTPKVFDGATGQWHENAAAVLHVAVPEAHVPELDIVNLFTDGDGPALVFPGTGFSATECTVDGVPGNIGRYLLEHGVDTRLPLVADYAGAKVNVSVQDIDPETGKVTFYAPVVAGQSYRVAQPIADYAGAYASGAGEDAEAERMLACNCVLNFLYANLEGQRTGGFVGPVTFGEIAYILLNQTLVRLALKQSLPEAMLRALAAAR